MQNRPYIRSRSSKIINFGANRKRVYTFLLVTDVKKLTSLKLIVRTMWWYHSTKNNKIFGVSLDGATHGASISCPMHSYIQGYPKDFCCGKVRAEKMPGRHLFDSTSQSALGVRRVLRVSITGTLTWVPGGTQTATATLTRLTPLENGGFSGVSSAPLSLPASQQIAIYSGSLLTSRWLTLFGLPRQKQEGRRTGVCPGPWNPGAKTLEWQSPCYWLHTA